MRKVIVLLGGFLFCHSAAAVELVTSDFSSGYYRFYFELHLTELPLEGVTINFFTEQTCVIIPPNHERFQFTFNPDGGEITENPEVTTVGTPALDRWADGPVDHLVLGPVDFLEWVITGSISHGSQKYQPGDRFCMRIDTPGGSHAYSGLLIKAAPDASVYLKKSSTTEIVSQAGQVIPYSYRVENVSPVYIHDVAVSDDNVDEPPVCAFSGIDVLTPEGRPGSVIFCTAEHTVTQDEIDEETGVSNTATATGDGLDPVTASLTLPGALFASGFESPPNMITRLDPTGGASEIAIGADGHPIIAYVDNITGDLKIAKCLDIQCTAAQISLLHGGGNQIGSPSIAVGQDSLPIISYSDGTDGVLLVAHCNDAACSGGDDTISVVDDGNVGFYSSIAIGTDGMPVISYHDRENGKLKVASCNDPACAGEDEIITTLNDPETSTGINTSLAIGADGFPVISYQKLVSPWDGTLKVAKCNDPSCVGGDEIITTLDTTGGPFFESTSLAVGLDGNPVIAYKDTRAAAITVAKCNDPACSGGDETFTAVDFNNQVMRVSLALAPDGNPIISYKGSLNVARCNDPACTGEDESIAVVDAEVSGGGSSIAIGVDGLPVISYGGLSVVHCGTLECR